jgi:hypothetical protein
MRQFLGLSPKTKVDGLVVWTENYYYGLVSWVSKALRRFLGLDLKTKGRRFVGLRLKTDKRMKTV